MAKATKNSTDHRRTHRGTSDDMVLRINKCYGHEISKTKNRNRFAVKNRGLMNSITFIKESYLQLLLSAISGELLYNSGPNLVPRVSHLVRSR